MTFTQNGSIFHPSIFTFLFLPHNTTYTHNNHIYITMTSFFSKISSRSASINSLLCVGLDPHRNELSSLGITPTSLDTEVAAAALKFCIDIIDATRPYAVAYKPNAAFFECLGSEGHNTLLKVINHIGDDIPVLLDCKRGDIGSTASAYAVASYDKLMATGVTLSPLMGYDSVAPFLTGEYEGKGGAFVLCKTSNPGSSEILSGCFEKIARLAADWSLAANGGDATLEPCIGLVVGATDPDALKRSRASAPGLWLLSPGVGAQGGDLDAACEAGLDEGGGKMLIPVSRGISRAEDRGEKAKELRDNINRAREKVKGGRGGGGDEIENFQREFINFSLEMGVLKFGTFTLKSGRER